MLVLTSVIDTVTPGSAAPDWSSTLPTRPPLTACACAGAAQATMSAAADAHAASVRGKRRAIPFLLETNNARVRPRALLPGSCGRRELADSNVTEGDLVAVILQQDMSLDLPAPERLVLELALRLGRHQRR